MSVSEFVAMIPDSLWGVLVGSTITLAGLALNNHQQNKRLREQLRHQSQENTAERHFAVRSERYVEAFAEISRATRYLTNLPDIDPASPEWRSGLDSFYDSLQKSALVSSDATNAAISEFVGAYSKAYLKLMPLLQPVHGSRTDRDINDDLVQTYQNEVERVLAAKIHFNESGNKDEGIWNALNTNFESAKGLRQEAVDARSEAWGKFNESSLSYRKAVMVELKSLAPLMVEALACIRSELSIETDLDAFRNLADARLVEALSAFDEFVKTIEDDD